MKTSIANHANTAVAKCILLIAFLLSANLMVKAEIFSTKQSGNYDQREIWSPYYPGNVIKEEDTVVINNEINHNIDLVIRGTMVVQENASLSGIKKLIIIKSGTLLNLGNSKFGALTNRGVIYNQQKLEVALDFINSGNIINYSNIDVANILDNTGVIAGKGGSLSAARKFINSRSGTIKGHLDVCSNDFLNVEGGMVDTETTTFCGNTIFNNQGMFAKQGDPLHFEKSASIVSLKTGEYEPF